MMVVIFVIKCVLIQLDHTSVPVIMDMNWVWTRRHVLVRMCVVKYNTLYGNV